MTKVSWSIRVRNIFKCARTAQRKFDRLHHKYVDIVSRVEFSQCAKRSVTLRFSSNYYRGSQCDTMRDNEEREDVKNLDYKNASSGTVTNSRTFLRPANYTYFHERPRERAPSNPRHLGDDSSLRKDFRQDESRARCCAIVLSRAMGFPGSFPTGAITEFVRAPVNFAFSSI